MKTISLQLGESQFDAHFVILADGVTHTSVDYAAQALDAIQNLIPDLEPMPTEVPQPFKFRCDMCQFFRVTKANAICGKCLLEKAAKLDAMSFRD